MSGLQVTYRGCVNAWECDQWGHQNVQFYLAKAADAQAALCCALGLAPSQLRSARRALVTASERILFKRELRAGDAVCIRSGVRAVHGAALGHFSVMTNEETGESAALFETEARLTDLDSGAACGLAAPVAAKAAEMARAGAGHERPAGSERPQAPPGAPRSTVLTYRGAFESWECDETGRVPPRFQIARFAESATHLFHRIGASKPVLRSRNLGSAALEYAIDYRAPLRPGQAVEIRSGMLEVRGKVLRFFHELLDAPDGEIATRIEVAALFFDLAARKAVPIPTEAQAGALALLEAGCGAKR